MPYYVYGQTFESRVSRNDLPDQNLFNQMLTVLGSSEERCLRIGALPIGKCFEPIEAQRKFDERYITGSPLWRKSYWGGRVYDSQFQDAGLLVPSSDEPGKLSLPKSIGIGAKALSGTLLELSLVAGQSSLSSVLGSSHGPPNTAPPVLNRLTILKHLSVYNQLSLIELAAITGLTPENVHFIVKGLQTAGIVEKEKPVDSRSLYTPLPALHRYIPISTRCGLKEKVVSSLLTALTDYREPQDAVFTISSVAQMVFNDQAASKVEVTTTQLRAVSKALQDLSQGGYLQPVKESGWTSVRLCPDKAKDLGAIVARIYKAAQDVEGASVGLQSLRRILADNEAVYFLLGKSREAFSRRKSPAVIAIESKIHEYLLNHPLTTEATLREQLGIPKRETMKKYLDELHRAGAITPVRRKTAYLWSVTSKAAD